MGYVRLRIRELAEQKGWTFREVADRSGVNYQKIGSKAPSFYDGFNFYESVKDY